MCHGCLLRPQSTEGPADTCVSYEEEDTCVSWLRVLRAQLTHVCHGCLPEGAADSRHAPFIYDRQGGDFLLVDGQGAAKTGAGLYDLNPKP